MSKINALANIWSIVKESDLRPLRDSATRGVNIVIVGAPGSGQSALAAALHLDPARPENITSTPLTILDLDTPGPADAADLIILMVSGGQANTIREQELVRGWNAARKPVLVFVNYAPPQLAPGQTAAAAIPSQAGAASGAAAYQSQADRSPQPAPTAGGVRARSRGVVRGSVHDGLFLTREFAPAVLDLLPNHLLGLGRSYPFFRVPVAQYLINDTCYTNAAYSFTTALAETVAVFNVPIAMTDMVILTKNQLFLIYKLGLALGFSTRWQDYVAEFGGVLGAGFVWRQIARSLIGMVPVWGIIPKTAISYAGTYTVGHGVLQWYLTGRHLDPQQLKSLYLQAFEAGRSLARRLLRRSPRLPKRRSVENADADSRRLRINLPRIARLGRRKPAELPPPVKSCPDCGRSNAQEARFCQFCGHVY